MRLRYRVFAATALVILAWSASAMADPSNTNELLGKQWTSDTRLLADVAEVEPNNSLSTAQLLGCGNVLRPATLAAGVTPPDTDYVSFTANAGERITIATDANGAGSAGDTRIRLFNNSGATLATDDDSGPGLYSLISNFVAPYTGTYYVGIAGFNATFTGNYLAAITCLPPPPANDVCAGASELPCGVIALSGSTVDYTHNYTPFNSGLGGCTGFTAFGRDLVYRIDADANDMLSVVYTSTADGSIYLITNCASPTTTCVAGADATLAGEPELLNYQFPSAGTYYLIIDSFGTNTFGDYTLEGTLECGVVPTQVSSWGRVKTTYR